MTACAQFAPLAPAQVLEGFLQAPPLISKQLIDKSYQHPSWLRDAIQVEDWPLGAGTAMEQIIFRGSMPEIERDFSKWRKLANNTGCNACSGPDCSYNWSSLGGTSFDRKTITLMDRDFRSASYCVKDIQTTLQFEEVFAKTVENLWKQISFFKEVNINFNILTSLSKKLVVDGQGPKPNPANPYAYRNIGTARLSRLNMRLCEFIYDFMTNSQDCVPIATVDGAPLFAMISSRQLISDMYREDPNLRQDARFSGSANDLLSKYNFQSTIRGMFIPATIQNPRRFNIVNGEPIEAYPTVNGIPAEIGSYTGLNPAYLTATHEEVIFHGLNPVKLYTMSTTDTLGQNTSFGPEVNYFNNFAWVNNPTEKDPMRRVGYFMTSATIGIDGTNSEGMFAVLVERPSVASVASYYPEPECVPEASVCTNVVPASTCPCPTILSVVPNSAKANTYVAEFAVAVEAGVGESILFGLQSGGYLTGTVTAVDTTGHFVEFTLPSNTPVTVCTQFSTVFCDNTLGCSSDVLALSCTDAGYSMVLKTPIRATTRDQVITGFCSDGSTVDLTIVSVNLSTNTWVVTASADCACGGTISVCVPPTTDAGCPSCDRSVTIEADCS